MRLGLVVAALMLSALPSFAQEPAPASLPPVDYASDSSWLCRPGRHDACDIDLSTTIIAADGTMRREAWRADANAPVDCFYVYPTISTDAGPHSDMTPDPAELNVIAQQFARFGQVCRVFAPLYRQVTLAGLRQGMATRGGGLPPLGEGPNYEDVRAAFRHYIEHDNKGRGVVLIGHSQGAFILTSLVAREIDGTPLQARLVSAMLFGATVPVARGKDVGGAFKQVPLCRSARQTGCVLTFASFRATVPPPANSLFGRVADPAQVAACTNPAALGGGRGELKAYLDTKGRTITGVTPPKPWVATGAAVETPWVSVPGLLTAECKTNEHATYLEVTVNGNPADPRVDDIIGDLGAGPQVLANWGLHLVDMNLAMGNLLDIVREQGRAFAAQRK